MCCVVQRGSEFHRVYPANWLPHLTELSPHKMQSLRPQFYELVPIELATYVNDFVAWLVPEVRRVYSAPNKRTIDTMIFREFSFNYRNERYYDMATKSKSDGKTTGNSAYRKTQWANIRVQVEDTPIIQERAENEAECLGQLFVLFNDGFDVFVKRRPDNKTVSVTITAQSIRDPNFNVGLSAYAPDVFVAVSALLFKYHDIAGGQIEDFVSSGSGDIG